MATGVETVCAGHRVSIPRTSLSNSTRLAGVVVKAATMLTHVTIHPFIHRVERIGMERWRIGAGFAVKTCICRSTARIL